MQQLTVFLIQKYFNTSKPEYKNLCEKIVLYTTYILLHIAIIHTSLYREVFLTVDVFQAGYI